MGVGMTLPVSSEVPSYPLTLEFYPVDGRGLSR